MIIEGAIINEQSQTFGIIVVKPSALADSATANKTREIFKSSLLEFRNIPLVLASQDSNGNLKYHGRTDIVKFLASINPSRIPWERYTYTS